MSDNPLDALTFCNAFTELTDVQKRMLESFTKMDFAAIEKRLAAHMIRPRGKSAFDGLFIAADWADGPDRTAVIAGIVNHGTVFIIDDFRHEPELLDLREVYRTYGDNNPPVLMSPFRADGYIGDKLLDMKIGHIDGFRFIDSPLVQEPEEPRAKNGAKANKKTERAKAKLAFYQGKRRF
jgi:hypothetical protein